MAELKDHVIFAGEEFDSTDELFKALVPGRVNRLRIRVRFKQNDALASLQAAVGVGIHSPDFANVYEHRRTENNRSTLGRAASKGMVASQYREALDDTLALT